MISNAVGPARLVAEPPVPRPGAGRDAARCPASERYQVAQELGEERQDGLARRALGVVIGRPIVVSLVVAVPGAEAHGDSSPRRGNEQFAVPGGGRQTQLDGFAVR